MLNPDLYLNAKLFDSDVEKKAIRDGFGEALLELGKSNENVVVLSADLSESCKADKFLSLYPDRYFECGVAEQNMVGIAAGLAISGKIPFISSFSVFSPGKNWEAIRTLIAYDKSNVKIAGHHAGIATGEDGATHQATEDLAIIRCLPNIEVFVPCDSNQAKNITISCSNRPLPSYLRFTRPKTPIITTDKTPYDFKKIEVYWKTQDPDVVIFATGYSVYYSLLAAKELENEKVNVLVANVSTIKPLDENTILELVKGVKGVVTVEDHQINGGLGSSISELLAKNNPKRINFVGIKDTFAESGSFEELIKKYGIDKEAIKKAVKEI